MYCVDGISHPCFFDVAAPGVKSGPLTVKPSLLKDINSCIFHQLSDFKVHRNQRGLFKMQIPGAYQERFRF